MLKNCELRAAARQALKEKWGMAAIASLVYIIILAGVDGILAGVDGGIRFIGLLIAILILPPLMYGFYVLFLRSFRGEELKVEKLFDGFKEYGRILGTLILVKVYTALWSLLLIVPGVIKGYSYALTPYILLDEPELSFNAAIEKSMALMKGQKMKLFLLDLSFIGWFILALITFCIGFIWLNPYVLTAHAAFYEELKKGNAAAA